MQSQTMAILVINWYWLKLGKTNESNNFDSMICFPNGKINLGLNILSKRPDGYHNIESIIYPIPLFDVMEIQPADSFQIQMHGIDLGITSEQNLVTKTWNLLSGAYDVPPVVVQLLKNIPAGSGLGGGSADAAFFLTQMNQYFSLGLDRDKLLNLALQIGSDCPFFIDNVPALVSGRGETVEPVELSLKGYYLVLVFPDIRISTQKAYSMASVSIPEKSLRKIGEQLLEIWKDEMVNDFERNLFNVHPELKKIKTLLYEDGANYASLTGSGSALFGIFEKETPRMHGLEGYWTWVGRM